MNRNSFLIAFIVATVLHCMPLKAQDAFLYKIKKQGVAHESYLYGTIHVQDQSVFNYGVPLFKAIEACDKAVFEMELTAESMGAMGEFINSEQMEAFAEKMLRYLVKDMIPKLVKEVPAEELATFITEGIYSKVEDVLDQFLKSDGRNELFLDMFLHEYALSINKEIIGLETASEQLYALLTDVVNYDFEKDKFTEKMIAGIRSNANVGSLFQNYISSHQNLVHVYSNHDFKELCNQVTVSQNSSSELERNIYKRVMLGRNDIMFERSLPLVESGSTFIAVGSGHLCGSNGLIAQFQKAGYTLEPIAPEKELPKAIQWQTYTAKNEYVVSVPNGVDLDKNGQFFSPKGMLRFSVFQKYDFAEDFDFIETDEASEEAYFEDELEVEEVDIEDFEMIPPPPPAPPVLNDSPVTADSNTNKPAKMDFKAEMNELMKDSAISAYFKIVSEKVMTYFMESNFKKQMEAMMEGGSENIYDIGKGKNKVTLTKNTSKLRGNSITAEYLTKSGNVYTLKLEGNLDLLTQKEIEKFFLSFKPEGGLQKAPKNKKSKKSKEEFAW